MALALGKCSHRSVRTGPLPTRSKKFGGAEPNLNRTLRTLLSGHCDAILTSGSQPSPTVLWITPVTKVSVSSAPSQRPKLNPGRRRGKATPGDFSLHLRPKIDLGFTCAVWEYVGLAYSAGVALQSTGRHIVLEAHFHAVPKSISIQWVWSGGSVSHTRFVT